jgi:hypothetical protein
VGVNGNHRLKVTAVICPWETRKSHAQSKSPARAGLLHSGIRTSLGFQLFANNSSQTNQSSSEQSKRARLRSGSANERVTAAQR